MCFEDGYQLTVCLVSFSALAVVLSLSILTRSNPKFDKLSKTTNWVKLKNNEWSHFRVLSMELKVRKHSSKYLPSIFQVFTMGERVKHKINYYKYLLPIELETCIVSYRPSFFLNSVPNNKHGWAITLKRKKQGSSSDHLSKLVIED